ncbi:MAG: nucleotidyl transferase AbiEii/AbiGii toxin family protein [Cephaloticoccus sp.]|nr:nucleotidyl transferase AbiEii/AbiGii toxin family protein [Cephaloticoccus sp.]MCF7761894.1 nucleotidyl transferase AbiEii/AbiGii toxin family protein [Cephaloticoccus sp.]
MNIVAWGQVAPWAEQRQIEQDLIISRALVEIFRDPFLRSELRFRGGTALNKLHFPAPLRYSEDIDLVRTTAGPIGPIIDGLRGVLEPWLDVAKFDMTKVAPKLRFRTPAEDGTGPIRLKVEINTHEIEAYDAPLAIPFRVENPWFTGEAPVSTFSREEMLATKLRALLQRNKGRDLFDLAHALQVFTGLDTARVVAYFGRYLAQAQQVISRAEAERRMFSKLANPSFLSDMRPLLSAAEAMKITDDFTKHAFEEVFREFITKIPGESWAKTPDMKQRFDVLLK